MSLFKTLIISIGISCAAWLTYNLLPPIVQILRGHATGVAFYVPRVLQFLPRPLQIPATLFGIPIVIGILIGCCWYLLSRTL